MQSSPCFTTAGCQPAIHLLCAFLLAAAPGCGSAARPRAGGTPTSRDSGEVWLSSYLAGKKIGYAVYRFNRLEDGYRFDDLLRMTIGMMGKVQMLKVRSVAITSEDLTLRSFDFEMSSQDASFSARGRMENGRLILSGGPTGQTGVLTAGGPLYPVEAMGRVVLRDGLRVGEARRYLVFDGTVLDTMGADVRMLGVDWQAVAGESLPLVKVEVKRAGLAVTVWLDSGGLALREESPIGMSATRTSPEQALVGESEGGRLDVLRLFCVPVDTVVRRPSTVRRALLELSGVPLAELKLDGAGQTLVESAPVRLETRVPPLPGGPVALPVSAETAFLSPTMSLQCNDRDVRAKAGAIVGGLTDATAAARALERWVFENLRKEATASFPNAVAVLRSMSGDCNEHAVLYAALARAAGIPARLAVGLVYLDGAFYYHAWDEVYLGHWVSVDPTFGEFPAGALRIRLGGGEVGQQAEILGLVRRIQIRLVEFE